MSSPRPKSPSSPKGIRAVSPSSSPRSSPYSLSPPKLSRSPIISNVIETKTIAEEPTAPRNKILPKSSFRESVPYYDALHEWKNYREQANRLVRIIRHYFQNVWDGKKGKISLLDVGCGTGTHILHLKEYFNVQGLDSNMEFIKIARKHSPEIIFHLDDMRNFDLDTTYDVILCLDTIGYITNLDELKQTMRSIRRHLKPEGVLFIEPYIFPNDFKTGIPCASYVSQELLKVSRMNITRVSVLDSAQILAHLDYRFQVANPFQIFTFDEGHTLGLFTYKQYQEAISAAGIHKIDYDKEGLSYDGRGFFIGSFGEKNKKKKLVYCKLVCAGDWSAQLNYLIEKGWIISAFVTETESKYRELDDCGKPMVYRPSLNNKGIGWSDTKTQCILLQKEEFQESLLLSNASETVPTQLV